jgi:hypothetical protein
VSLRDELQAIYDQHGRLTPELVVQVARPRGHPLHDRVFDRAPKQAAEAWYRHRAHELIRSVRVVYRDADEAGPERSVRAYHAVPTPAGPVYEPAEMVALDPFQRQLLLRQMERDWKALRARYGMFAEFAELVAGDLAAAAEA